MTDRYSELSERRQTGPHTRPSRKLVTRRIQDQESAEQVRQALRYGTIPPDSGEENTNPFLPTPEDEDNISQYQSELENSGIAEIIAESLGDFETDTK